MKYIEVLFWISFSIVFYTYIGYGIILVILVKLKELFFKENCKVIVHSTPEITLFITAYNEEQVIDPKMKNSLSLNYPKEKLKIVWVVDGSNDGTLDELKKHPEAIVYFRAQREGKTAAINRGMKHISSPIVVFTDANTMLNSEALIEIVKKFNQPKVGCVAGEKRVLSHEKDGAAGGEGIYWKYESKLKSLDSRLYSTIGAAGELFAIRTTLFEEMKNDTLLDDFVLSLSITLKGYKIAYCKTAYAIEYSSENITEEEKRKVRIAAGGLQSIWRLKPLLNIFKYGVLSFQYISHRVLRWSVTPILLFALLPLNIPLLYAEKNDIYITSFILQIIFYIMSVWGYYLSMKHIKNKILFVPYYFLFMNINIIKGLFYLINKDKTGIWEKSKRSL